MSTYITDPKHAETLMNALHDFHEALTYRWREVVTDKMMYVSQEGFPRGLLPQWEYRNEQVLNHLRMYCVYVKWVQGGQEGDLNSVSCDGYFPPSPGTSSDGHGTIQCGMGDVLKNVGNWAWGEREVIRDKVPLFDGHDLRVLEAAHNAFLTVGNQLGLERGDGSAKDVGKAFDPMNERELAGKVADLSGERAEGQDWWAGWTGLAASRAKAGFFASTTPTLNNQSRILGCLANLYAARAAIIEKGRNDGLYWIQWATKSLKEKQRMTTAELLPGWKVVEGLGTAIQIGSNLWKHAGPVGAAVTLVGFIGENLIPKITHEGYKHDLIEVVDQLSGKISELLATIGTLESEYGMKVAELEDTIYGIHSYNLELYDLTQNNPTGDDAAPKEGYTANIDDILKIGQACYEAGDLYADLFKPIASTTDADQHLADQDFRANEADLSLQQIRTQLEEFVKTACGRYMVAGDQVKAAAEAYAQTDVNRKAAFDRVMDDWQKSHVGPYAEGYNPTLEDEAGATDRPDRGDSPTPGSSNQSPSAAPPKPGEGDGEDYETQ